MAKQEKTSRERAYRFEAEETPIIVKRLEAYRQEQGMPKLAINPASNITSSIYMIGKCFCKETHCFDGDDINPNPIYGPSTITLLASSDIRLEKAESKLAKILKFDALPHRTLFEEEQ